MNRKVGTSLAVWFTWEIPLPFTPCQIPLYILAADFDQFIQKGPKADSLVITTGSQPTAVGAKSQGSYPVLMTSQFNRIDHKVVHVPETDGSGITRIACSQPAAIGTEGY
jgi:hypothetical protein